MRVAVEAGMTIDYAPIPALANGNSAGRGIFYGSGALKRSSRIHALDILGFQSLFAGNGFKENFVAFVQGFESRADDGRVMHKNVLTGILGDEAEALFVVEPLYFSAGHKQFPSCEALLQNKTGRNWKPVASVNQFWKWLITSIRADNKHSSRRRQGEVSETSHFCHLARFEALDSKVRAVGSKSHLPGAVLQLFYKPLTCR
jgi:hypothetical protein